jgi:hypothetical protein
MMGAGAGLIKIFKKILFSNIFIFKNYNPFKSDSILPGGALLEYTRFPAQQSSDSASRF